MWGAATLPRSLDRESGSKWMRRPSDRFAIITVFRRGKKLRAGLRRNGVCLPIGSSPTATDSDALCVRLGGGAVHGDRCDTPIFCSPPLRAG